LKDIKDVQVSPGERFYDPDRVLSGAMHAVEIARNRGATDIDPDDLLAGLLLAVARFGIVEFGTVALDLAALALPYDLPAPELVLRPRYGEAAAAVFDRAARIGRADGGGPLRPLYLLVALGDSGLPLMRRVLTELGRDAAGWRRLLAAVEPPPRSQQAQSEPPETAARTAADLLSPEQAATELGIHIQTLRGYIRRGKLPAFRLAGERAIRIRRDDLNALLTPPAEATSAEAERR
jgi:excisionase family DNA binding protein